jgi:hypothetical protein
VLVALSVSVSVSVSVSQDRGCPLREPLSGCGQDERKRGHGPIVREEDPSDGACQHARDDRPLSGSPIRIWDRCPAATPLNRLRNRRVDATGHAYFRTDL